MTHKLNLFLFVILALGIKAQHKTKMENKNELMATGQIIKHGKMIYTEILINALPEKVWRIFSDFEKYPLWNPFITSLNGKPNKGSYIEVILHPPLKKAMLFKPKILVYDTLREFRWIGKLGISRLFDGEHVFILKDNNNGTTTFIQYERFRGILVPFLNKMLNTSTKEGFNQMNEALKKRCEN